MYRLLKPRPQMSPNPFLEKFIPDLDSWGPILLSGLSPHSPGEAEAIKRQLILNGLTDLQGMETWYWDAERIEEVMSIPVENHSGDSFTFSLIAGEDIETKLCLNIKASSESESTHIQCAPDFWPGRHNKSER